MSGRPKRQGNSILDGAAESSSLVPFVYNYSCYLDLKLCFSVLDDVQRVQQPLHILTMVKRATYMMHRSTVVSWARFGLN